MKKSAETFKALAGRTAVTLVGTRHAGNIGAAARVMHNFGFRDLRLVEPRAEIGEEARRLSRHSQEILEKAERHATLDAAVRDVDLRIGATRRMGRRRGRYLTPPELSEALAGLDAKKTVALIFGPEDDGLSNEHLGLCDWLVTIPAGSDFESLNLSHAVAVVLYDIHRHFHAATDTQAEASALLDGLLEHLEQTLRRIGFIGGGRDPRRTMVALRRMIARGAWRRNEMRLFHAILNQVETDKGEKAKE